MLVLGHRMFKVPTHHSRRSEQGSSTCRHQESVAVTYEHSPRPRVHFTDSRCPRELSGTITSLVYFEARHRTLGSIYRVLHTQTGHSKATGRWKCTPVSPVLYSSIPCHGEVSLVVISESCQSIPVTCRTSTRDLPLLAYFQMSSSNLAVSVFSSFCPVAHPDRPMPGTSQLQRRIRDSTNRLHLQ